MTEDEAALVWRVAGGDEAAFRQLRARHLASISRYARRMLDDSDEAEDVTQEVFLRLWTEAYRFRPASARLTTWLHRIAHNLCVDWRRKHGRMTVAGEDLPEGDTGTGPQQDLEAAARARRVRAAVNALPERQRDALLLCHYQGLGNQEAGLVLGVGVEAIESLLSRARRRLRQEMEDENGY